MMSCRAIITAAVIASCWANVAATLSSDIVDFDSPGLSLLQLRFASTSSAEAMVVEKSVEAKTAALRNVRAEEIGDRVQALPWPAADYQAVPQRTLPWSTVQRQPSPERTLPWLASPAKQDALLDVTKADENFIQDTVSIGGQILPSPDCHFTEAEFGVSPGSYNNLAHDVTTLMDCQKLCDAEDSCLAIVYKDTRSVCITLPRKYDDNFIKRKRGGVVLNRVCPEVSPTVTESSSPAPGVEDTGAVMESSSPVSAVKDDGCAFSTAIRGHSPGPSLHEHGSVATLEACQKLCNLDTACLAVVHREGEQSCITLAHPYNDNYEVTSDDAITSNKRCTS